MAQLRERPYPIKSDKPLASCKGAPALINRIFLVSCVAGKRTQEVPAADLYTSPWFRKTRALVEATSEPWFILSAEYGLVTPNQVIGPYNRTLNMMKLAERCAWAERVQAQMELGLPEAQEVVVFAGSRYREGLLLYLEARFDRVTVPMAGLSIGR